MNANMSIYDEVSSALNKDLTVHVKLHRIPAWWKITEIYSNGTVNVERADGKRKLGIDLRTAVKQISY